MPESLMSDDTPATVLFPQFESELYRMIFAEVEGLTDRQLDFESERWKWSAWSIRRNLSHVSSGDFRWLLIRWGDQLFPNGLPDVGDLDSLVASPYDRRLDEDKYWDVDVILEKLRQGLALCQSVLSRETIDSLRHKEIKNDNSAQWQQFSQAHPGGIREDSMDPSTIYISLEVTFRHRYFEHITHLYNIQRLKRAQGLAARVEIPVEGYWALPDWDRSEPYRLLYNPDLAFGGGL